MQIEGRPGARWPRGMREIIDDWKTRWLIREFNPAREVPGTGYINVAKISARDGRHNSTLP